jgi:hypothetical protein
VSAPGASNGSPSHKSSDGGSIGQTFQLVKDYARQETLGPLRGAGRWLAFGVAGAVLLGLGAAFAPTFRGRWMALLPYAISLLLALVIIAIAVSRIFKTSLQKEKRS